ncbi:hypothetical protein ACQEU5_13845 [Marinactinospora thermotolerans]|uniref:Asp23 family, cell envelope-related function n=1 Tax=Marinactinospora thermotolerans DSM 45154 TaxID=1122192 RepID=A0A1T4RWK2_9ACTN|nr:hypothetical protein [Marinactinospora thermotolerans]SKA20360.1 hypothetical protein SAMN02745673_03050 [Marinactinospora thermotolerans DSM 45154]
MAVEPTDHDRLPCGTDLTTLAGHLAEGALTAHERNCSHCRGAVRRLRALDSARDDLASESVSAPPQLLDEVMRVVRTEGRPGRALPVPPEQHGVTRVREPAAARILRTAAETVGGISVGRCRISEEDEGLSVLLTARVETGAAIPELAEAARRAVRDAARHQLGWTLIRVDVEVVDLS